MTDFSTLYDAHLQTLDKVLQDCLDGANGTEGLSLDGVLFHAGEAEVFFADDQEKVFHSVPHFRRWVPLEGPSHLVFARPGARTRVIRVMPQDYWYDTGPPPTSYWEEKVDLREVENLEAAKTHLPELDRIAYVGSSPAVARSLGFAEQRVQPPSLLAALDWYRGYKTPWETALVAEAVRLAAGGHLAARQAFLEGGTEREIHWAYLRGAEHLESELPFGSIMALDRKASILHYQHKRGTEYGSGEVLLADAGAVFGGYAADLTRTWARETVDPRFKRLIDGVDSLEQKLVAMVAPGLDYAEIHYAAHRGLASLLSEVGVLKVSEEEALDRGWIIPFMPHGVGHHMGIQVHDVGGKQLDPSGAEKPSPQDHPFLRTTRVLEPGHLVTIEPGLYFIDLLLKPLRAKAEEAFDWSAIDALSAFGGIRIEDDVLCTETGYQDLSRHLLPGPQDV